MLISSATSTASRTKAEVQARPGMSAGSRTSDERGFSGPWQASEERPVRRQQKKRRGRIVISSPQAAGPVAAVDGGAGTFARALPAGGEDALDLRRIGEQRLAARARRSEGGVHGLDQARLHVPVARSPRTS